MPSQGWCGAQLSPQASGWMREFVLRVSQMYNELTSTTSRPYLLTTLRLALQISAYAPVLWRSSFVIYGVRSGALWTRAERLKNLNIVFGVSEKVGASPHIYHWLRLWSTAVPFHCWNVWNLRRCNDRRSLAIRPLEIGMTSTMCSPRPAYPLVV